MNSFKIIALCFFLIFTKISNGQIIKKSITAKRIKDTITLDGNLNESVWKNNQVADKFVCLRPIAFKPENNNNKSEVYFLYNDEGIYIGGYFHESNKDSISSELTGRDGFGNNDFVGIVFDTYNDKLNGFEYFVTPLGEQMDAKHSANFNGNSEDFSWNAVWKSAAQIHNDGWSFEIFLPYSAIRFSKKNIQDWGLNIIRKRRKSGEQLFWQTLDPNINGFLTQEGMLLGLQNISPPLRLQFTPYFSVYQNHDDLALAGTNKNKTNLNGGMDIKYGLNQAMTLDMTLIPDFGQVVTDNKVLNLSPFEQKFAENRTFFTEGNELFSKGNLFYSRRIGRIGETPLHYNEVPTTSNEIIEKNPESIKLINATKISGRSQNGLGIGILNAVTNPQNAIILNTNNGQTHKFETEPLTNYNVFVLDKTLKHNSSVSLVNTNVWRAGKDYEANVSSALFDFNDKKNTWNIGGNVSVSNIISNKTITGYAHSIYFGKTSGRFNFNFWQDLTNAKYDKSDLGFLTNNNDILNGFWMAYNFTKPSKWFTQMRINTFFAYSSLVTPKDILKRKSMMFQTAENGINVFANLKNLWTVGLHINNNLKINDFYEPRVEGRVIKIPNTNSLNLFWESNSAKKISWGGSLSSTLGGIFNGKNIDNGYFIKIRFSNKFSIDQSLNLENGKNKSGFAAILYNGSNPDTIIFSRRNVLTAENILAFKYSFTNKMGLTLRVRHYWSKVAPLQFYQLDKFGDLQTPNNPFTQNVNQNYNFLSMDLVYTWQFAQGSFINIVWKNINENFHDNFEKNYFNNLDNTFKHSAYNNDTQFNSLSLRVIYFLDYLTAKKKFKNKF